MGDKCCKCVDNSRATNKHEEQQMASLESGTSSSFPAEELPGSEPQPAQPLLPPSPPPRQPPEAVLPPSSPPRQPPQAVLPPSPPPRQPQEARVSPTNVCDYLMMCFNNLIR